MARSQSHSQLRELHAEGEEGEPEVAAKSFTSTGTGEGSSDWGATQTREQVSKTKKEAHASHGNVACTKDRICLHSPLITEQFSHSFCTTQPC